MIGATCERCDYIHLAADVYALNRFAPRATDAYRAKDGTVHPTRDAAQEWLCQQRTATLFRGAGAPPNNIPTEEDSDV